MGYVGPERLERAHRLKTFDCGEEPLNHWIRTIAKGANASGSATVFVVCDDSRLVVGYYALAMASVSKAEATPTAAAHMPAHVPCVLLARLAVDVGHQGTGLGGALLKDALLRSASAAEAVGARAMLVHAKHATARDWYLRYGFEPSPTDELHLWLTMSAIRATLG